MTMARMGLKVKVIGQGQKAMSVVTRYGGRSDLDTLVLRVQLKL